MDDVRYICALQRDLCEYERFCGDLFLDLTTRTRQKHIAYALTDGTGFFELITKEIDKILAENEILRKENADLREKSRSGD